VGGAVTWATPWATLGSAVTFDATEADFLAVVFVVDDRTVVVVAPTVDAVALCPATVVVVSATADVVVSSAAGLDVVGAADFFEPPPHAAITSVADAISAPHCQ
jgi:hypothetical protein